MKFTYDRDYEVYKCGDWKLEKVGGFITISHWWVHNNNENIHFWQGTKREAIQLVKRIIINKQIYMKLDNLYKTALY